MSKNIYTYLLAMFFNVALSVPGVAESYSDPKTPPSTTNLAVTKFPLSAAGAVIANPGNLNCGTGCEQLNLAALQNGAAVTVTALPSAKYKFRKWSGKYCADSTSPICSFNVVVDTQQNNQDYNSYRQSASTSPIASGNEIANVASDEYTLCPITGCSAGQVLKAEFEPIDPVTLNLKVNRISGAGANAVIRSYGTALSCYDAKSKLSSYYGGPLNCSIAFPRGQVLKLTALDGDDFSRFTGFSVPCNSPIVKADSYECSVTLDSSQTIVGSFNPARTVRMVANGMGMGAVNSNPALKPMSSGFSIFNSWIRNDAQQSITANAGAVDTMKGINDFRTSGMIKLAHGGSIKLTAIAASDSNFDGWAGITTLCDAAGTCVQEPVFYNNSTVVLQPGGSTQISPIFKPKSSAYCNSTKQLNYSGTSLSDVTQLDKCIVRSVVVVKPSRCKAALSGSVFSPSHSNVRLREIKSTSYFGKTTVTYVVNQTSIFSTLGASDSGVDLTEGIRLESLGLSFSSATANTCSIAVSIK